MPQNPNARFNAAMTDFTEAMSSSGIDTKDFRVLVPRNQWREFANVTTGHPFAANHITKVTLGKIDFVPAE